MGKIIWLASYPKSGNTWLRILLTNYWRNGDQPASINQLEPTPLASSRVLFDDLAGIESANLSHDEIDRFRPAFYQRWANQHPNTAFLKVHDAYRLLPDGRPLLPAAATAGAIYLLRNPLDVALSLAAHNGQSVDQSIAALHQADYALCAAPHKQDPQLRQQLGSWSNHVRSWLDQAAQHFTVCCVRYEDLQAEPLRTFGKILRFLGEPEDGARMSKALTFSHFDRLQAQEAQEGFGERPGQATRFFRGGRSGDWRTYLTHAQAAQIIADHAPIMQRFGYLPET